MRTLILTCNTGQGHNSCAAAIREHFISHGDSALVVDALGFIPGPISRVVSGGHDFIYRNIPSLFCKGYKFAECHDSVFKERSAVSRIITSGSDRLADFIESKGFCAVICTHVFSAFMLSNALKRLRNTVVSAYVSTDYTCSPSTKESALDYCFVPDKGLINEFVGGKILRDKVVASGIPVGSSFFDCGDRAVAKRSLGLSEKNRHLLVMGGSMGCGPIRKITELLAENLDENCYATVVCGSNARLYRTAKRMAEGSRVRVVGFTNEISRLMNGSDLFLTKPGGLSVSEAATVGLPMVLIDAVSGCELYNLRFFEGLGAAKTSRSAGDAVDKCLKLLQNTDELVKMSKGLARFRECNASEIIRNTIKKNLWREKSSLR